MRRSITTLFFLVLAICLYGQDGEVQGLVSNEEGQPLAGVTVTVTETQAATMTDEGGTFSISAEGDHHLEFSVVGMQAQSVPIENRTQIQVTLFGDDQELDEVVVIGYQTVKKSDLTGAVSVFNPSEMKNTTVSGTVGDALGTLPGLNVRTAGNPGAEGKVEIRGTGTFGSSAPLYVVDGVIAGANRDFNFNDIESIQVLKDASAAAIYGSRAGNGVIIITTKQGKEGAMKIDLSSRGTAQWLPRYNLADRDLWINLNDLAFSNAGREPANHFDANTDWQEGNLQDRLAAGSKCLIFWRQQRQSLFFLG